MIPPRRRAVALTAALVASALALALVAAPGPASADAASDEARAVALVNAARAAAGVPALRVDASLTAAARDWAAVRAPAGDSQHNMRLGNLVSGASKLGEIIGRGPTVDAAHNLLMSSTAHRQIMLDPGFNSLGVGVAYAGGLVTLVVDFARMSAASAPEPAPAVAPVVTPAPVPAAAPVVAPASGPPAPPTALTASPSRVSARYFDPQGQAGRVYFWVLDAGGRVAAQGWVGPVCSGCTATMALPALAPGNYRLHAYASDGSPSTFAGPVAMTV